jgi:hypothetical protein
VDLVGKAGHVRTVPVPDWVRNELDSDDVRVIVSIAGLLHSVNPFLAARTMAAVVHCEGL